MIAALSRTSHPRLPPRFTRSVCHWSYGWRGRDRRASRGGATRIRRDLHDGLGPALAGLTFTLEAVRNLTNSDLQRADALLVSATDQVQTMIGDVRRLIYGLRPPTLDQLGLDGFAARARHTRIVARDTHVDR